MAPARPPVAQFIRRGLVWLHDHDPSVQVRPEVGVVVAIQTAHDAQWSLRTNDPVKSQESPA